MDNLLIDKVNNERDLLDKEQQWAYRLGCIRHMVLMTVISFTARTSAPEYGVTVGSTGERGFSVISAHQCRSLSRYSM